MTLSQDLAWRGLIKDRTFDDVQWLDQPQTFYLGVDCSADSMTIGNLAVVMLAKRLRRAGWKAVLLVGGATSLIGDPGGKHDERVLKPREEIERNVAAIKGQFEQLFDGDDFTLVDNYDWFQSIGYLEFLRDVGKHFSMTELVQRDFIASRMGEGGSGISYAEFSYSLIQGYDFWHLYKQHGVILQIGASDQWGNMLSGAPLIRKKESAEVHAMSMPLVINKSTGVKFGKSEAGAIWLDAERTSPTQLYQFWMNVDDAGVIDYLKIYTLLDQATIEQLTTEHQADPSARLAQARLASEVTASVHGASAAADARLATEVLTGRQQLDQVSPAVLQILRAEQPYARVAPGTGLIEILLATGLVATTSEARRLLAGNAISLNGQKTSQEQVQPTDFISGRLLIRKGKKFKDTALVELA